MSQRYLLSCSCGRTTPVGISQAGSTVACDCGQSLAVPTIRGLKALPPEKDFTDAPPLKSGPPTEYNGINLSGALFVVGLLLLLVGFGLGGFYGYLYSRIDTKNYDDEVLAYIGGEIDKMPPIEIYRTWKKLEEMGIGEYQEAPHLVAKQASTTAFRLMMTGVVLTIAGLGLIGYSVAGGSSVRRST
jgi:hypothetical protein